MKGLRNDAVLLWGIDYLKHDIPIYHLALAETHQAWDMFCKSLSRLNQGYKIFTCDDKSTLKEAISFNYPKSYIQACLYHIHCQLYRDLQIAKDKTHLAFYSKLLHALSIKSRHNPTHRKTLLSKLMKVAVEKHNEVEMKTMFWLERRFGEQLTNYQFVRQTPLTSNLIETFNGELEDRLTDIGGFESFRHADAWINAWILNRRFKVMIGCKGKFRKLNGKRMIDQTKKLNIDILDVF